MSASGFEKLFGNPDVFSGTDREQTDGLVFRSRVTSLFRTKGRDCRHSRNGNIFSQNPHLLR